VIQYEVADSTSRSNGASPSDPNQRTVADPSNMLTIIGTITSQAVLITALFYYFGWVYAHGLFGYFGVDPSLIGFSTVDYALRSLNVAFYPFIDAAFAALVLFGIHRLVIAPALLSGELDAPPPLNTASGLSSPATPCPARLASLTVGWMRVWDRRRPGPSDIRRFLSALRVVAVLLAAVVLTGIFFPEQIGTPLGLLLPLILIVSVILFGYVAHMCWRYPNAVGATTPPLVTPPSRAYILTLLVLGLIAGLWAVSLYGYHAGVRHATDVATRLSTQSGVVIYSTERLALGGPGITVDDITQSDSKYHYQYTGLRLLTHSSDKFLLVPSGWQRGRDHVFLLRDDDSIRVDITVRS
jgi:hypothetical protein